jgi:hypothetical protein
MAIIFTRLWPSGAGRLQGLDGDALLKRADRSSLTRSGLLCAPATSSIIRIASGIISKRRVRKN